MAAPRSLFTHPVHLGKGAAILPQPEFTGMEWYADYIARTQADGDDGRLVSLYRFTQSWDSWERHPAGDELVLCISGRITLLQEQADGTVTRQMLGPGDYAINPPGVWHSAEIAVGEEACALFITAGRGTEHRPA
ncbi:MAG: cupin [Sphingobium sp. 32-64-5]|nr:MAG: cupin [Sphingobium sp. 32-64-5]